MDKTSILPSENDHICIMFDGKQDENLKLINNHLQFCVEQHITVISETGLIK